MFPKDGRVPGWESSPGSDRPRIGAVKEGDPVPISKEHSQRLYEAYLRKQTRRHELDPQGAADKDEESRIGVMEHKVWEAKQLEKQGWRCADCGAGIDAGTDVSRGRGGPGGFDVLDFVCQGCIPTPPVARL